MSAPLHERDLEPASLRALLAAAAAGAGGLAPVQGASGMGETSVLRGLRTQAAHDGFRVLSAGEAELERDFAGGELLDGFGRGRGGPYRISEALCAVEAADEARGSTRALTRRAEEEGRSPLAGFGRGYGKLGLRSRARLPEALHLAPA